MLTGKDVFFGNNSRDNQQAGNSTMEVVDLVGINSSVDTRELRTFGVGEVSMGQFAKMLPEAYKDLEQEIKEMGNQFFEYFNGKDTNTARRYISDVILYRNSDQLYSIVGKLCDYGGLRRTGMFGYSVEEDHIHVIHDCAYSDGTCRCRWRKQVESIGEIKPMRKENKSIWKFKRTDWYDVFIYFFLRKRGDRKVWIRGISWRPPSIGK